MTLHSEYTRIRIAHEPADEPGLAVSLHAHTAEPYSEASVSVYFGRTGFGQYGLQLALRGARELSMLLASFANIAEGLEAAPVPEPVDQILYADAIAGTPYSDVEVVEDPAQGSYADPDAEGKV